MPGPLQFASSGIERTHFTAGHQRPIVVSNGRSDDYQTSQNRRRRSRLILILALWRATQALAQINHSLLTEVAANGAGACVNRKKPRIDGSDKNAPTARLSRFPFRVEPGSNAPIGKVSPARADIGLGIEGPPRLARFRIQSDHAAEP